MVKKGPEAYRTIGEASKEVGEPSYVLRFWETKFNQIKLIKRPGGRRFYRPEDINLLIKIKNFLPGKAINFGIKKSKGSIIVCLSAHCIPVDDYWLTKLVGNLKNSTSN